jgi:S-DNA-T family DNA segregation ATPase FtsK/SpoIIIE
MARKSSFLGRKNYKFKLKKNTLYSVSSILLFCLAGLIWISFIRQGLLLSRVNSLIIEQFGLAASLFLPFPLVIGGLMVTKIKSSLGQVHVFIGSIVIIAALTGTFHSGTLGERLWRSASMFLSIPGAYLFLTAMFTVGIIIMLNIAFEDLINFFVKLANKSSISAKDKLELGQSIKMSGISPADRQTVISETKVPISVDKVNLKTTADNKTSKDMHNSPSQTMFQPPLAATNAPWHYPPISLLSENISGKADRGNVNNNAATIEKTLDAFGITAKVKEVNGGPAVTQYALEVAIGTKLSKINALSNDLALALAAPTGQIRIEAPIPGRSLVGIELPNRAPEFVSLRKILEDEKMKHHKSKIAVAMGLDVSGQAVVADISRMPHVLIAGQTGSGKSVCINAFIASLLFRCSPQELNLIMVDPKRVELTGYNGIPHLISPVIVEPEKVLSALKWSMAEMDRRYRLFAEVGVRNLEGYNELSGFQALPYIVIFIDELADIMLFAPVEVEDAITRIAQMARATGIHLVIATQRPSVDIITGLIKANIPTRIAFAVSSMIDSRVIIDQPGSEKLLGKGDMLYVPPEAAKPSRIQGAFVSDKEIRQLIEFLKKQGVAPNYTEEITTMPTGIGRRGGKGSSFISPSGEERDQLFEEALRMILQHENASASFLQRKLSVGYARAARILDELQQAGFIGPSDGSKPREILIRDMPLTETGDAQNDL